MNSLEKLFQALYRDHQDAYKILLPHSQAVASFAKDIALVLDNIDVEFIYESALYHDIGVFRTDAPKIGCYGDQPYLQHGVLGAELLREAGFNRHAVVCETHVGVAITKEEIIENSLPLPHRDMIPQSREEEIIAYADCFFNKTAKDLMKPKPFEKVLEVVSCFGERSRNQFLRWHEEFGKELVQ